MFPSKWTIWKILKDGIQLLFINYTRKKSFKVSNEYLTSFRTEYAEY